MEVKIKIIIGIILGLIGIFISFPPFDSYVCIAGGVVFGSGVYDLFLNSKKIQKKEFTLEDLKRAFYDGKAYGDNELELCNPVPNGEDNSFNRWYNTIFLENKK